MRRFVNDFCLKIQVYHWKVPKVVTLPNVNNTNMFFTFNIKCLI